MIRYRRVPGGGESLWEAAIMPFVLPCGALRSLLTRAASRIRERRP